MGDARRKKNRFKTFFPTGDLSIVQAGHPVLRDPAQDVDPAWFGGEQLEVLIQTMVQVMRQAPGVGLAAPQIGVPLRVAVIEDRTEYIEQQSEGARQARRRLTVPLTVLVNPKLTLLDPADEVIFDEGCLSVRGYVAQVARAKRVSVSAHDAAGAPLIWEAEGWAARIIQHECDHLDGTLYVDRMDTRTLAATL